MTTRTRRFAEDTEVPISRSRQEIEQLLQQWGCDGVRWTDHYRTGVVVLEFLWTHQEVEYLARISVTLPSDEELRAAAVTEARRSFSKSRYEKLQRSRGQQEHRLLLLWIKAALNAVDGGLVEAAAIFLPFLVGPDDRTVYEHARLRMPKLLEFGAPALLAAGPTPQ